MGSSSALPLPADGTTVARLCPGERGVLMFPRRPSSQLTARALGEKKGASP